MKKSILCLMLVAVMILSACIRKIPEQASYKMHTGERTWNLIEISNVTDGGFYLEASCCNASLNIGEFKGKFEFRSPDVAVFYDENDDGTVYTITAEFSGDNLIISVDAEEECAEFTLLEFGMNVYLSGKYEKAK